MKKMRVTLELSFPDWTDEFDAAQVGLATQNCLMGNKWGFSNYSLPQPEKATVWKVVTVKDDSQ